MGFSNETIASELQHVSKLHKKHLGELAELAFMRKAASMGFAVAKPWGDSDRYDIIVRFDKMFWRVQVKSVITARASRHSYRVKTTRGANGTYSADVISSSPTYFQKMSGTFFQPPSLRAGIPFVSAPNRKSAAYCNIAKPGTS